MTPKSEAAAAERKVMDRYEARLQKAYHEAYTKSHGPASAISYADHAGVYTLRILRASAAALFPGDQQRKHLLPALGKMVTASCRVTRKSGK